MAKKNRKFIKGDQNDFGAKKKNKKKKYVAKDKKRVKNGDF